MSEETLQKWLPFMASGLSRQKLGVTCTFPGPKAGVTQSHAPINLPECRSEHTQFGRCKDATPRPRTERVLPTSRCTHVPPSHLPGHPPSRGFCYQASSGASPVRSLVWAPPLLGLLSGSQCCVVSDLWGDWLTSVSSSGPGSVSSMSVLSVSGGTLVHRGTQPTSVE